MEFTVLKVIDGILISDSSIIHDQDFLYNNKISHAIGWLSSHQHIDSFQFESIGIKSISLSKRSQMPTLNNIQLCVQAISQSRDQYLCSLIYCEKIVQGLALVIPYFVFRFGWSVQTAVGFVERRLGHASVNIPKFYQYIKAISQEIPQILNNMLDKNKSKLKNIEWNLNFLQNYVSDDIQQVLIINTVKNTISQPIINNVTNYQTVKQKNDKNKRRIQWYDQITKNSITAGQRLFANSKISSSLKKSSSLKALQHKTSIKISNGDQMGSSCGLSNNTLVSNNLKQNNQSRLVSAKKTNQIWKQNQFDDFQYISLKQLSRTNFDDLKFRSSGLQKRRNLKIYKNQQKPNQKSKKKNLKITQELSNSFNKNLNFIQGIKVLDVQNFNIRA